MQSPRGTTPRAVPRLSKIKPPDRCPYCNSKRIIKKGRRKKKLEDVPLYRCRSCGRTFAPGPRAIRNKTYPLPEILEAFTLYDRGNTLEETAEKISSRYGHRVAPSTISRWLAEHPALTTYRRLSIVPSPHMQRAACMGALSSDAQKQERKSICRNNDFAT